MTLKLAFDQMEAAYRAARGEMAVYVGPAGAVGDLTSPRKRLTTAAWWWEADESRAYDEVDRAMAEGEMARTRGGKQEVLGEETQSRASFQEATNNYLSAMKSFHITKVKLVAIQARNHDQPAFGINSSLRTSP